MPKKKSIRKKLNEEVLIKALKEIVSSRKRAERNEREVKKQIKLSKRIDSTSAFFYDEDVSGGHQFVAELERDFVKLVMKCYETTFEEILTEFFKKVLK